MHIFLLYLQYLKGWTGLKIDKKGEIEGAPGSAFNIWHFAIHHDQKMIFRPAARPACVSPRFLPHSLPRRGNCAILP